MTITRVTKKLRETEEKAEQSGCSISGDIIQVHIMTLLDARSLARSAAVCTQWRDMALADKLWQPLCDVFWTNRLHIPLCIVWKSPKLSPHLAYAISIADSKQQELCPAEMCGHTWELRLKPPCGSYWLSLDPSQRGHAALRRYFHCDGSISSGPNDPIWGGQESVWRFLHVVGQDGQIGQHVQINHWPLFSVKRLKDGRWGLENYYAFYVTRPDNPTYASAPPCSKDEKVWAHVEENNGIEAEDVHLLGKVSPDACVQAWVALSKLCLADEDVTFLLPDAAGAWQQFATTSHTGP